MKIYWVTTRKHDYTIQRHLANSPSIRDLVHPINHSAFMRQQEPVIYVLTDIERLSSQQRLVIGNKADTLSRRGGTILNHPRKVQTRLPLLTTLANRGVNQFRACLATQCDFDAMRYPVFLRCENDHSGARSELLHSPQELKTAIEEYTRTRFFFINENGKRRIVRLGWKRRRNLLVTEVCDTGDTNGIFRKYGAFCLNGTIVARHLFFGKHWMVKSPDIITPALLAEEDRYVTENPHKEPLAKIFADVGIDYGRVDYGVLDGQVQVWEINTNPMITVPDEKIVERFAIHEKFGAPFNEAIRAMSFNVATAQRQAAA